MVMAVVEALFLSLLCSVSCLVPCDIEIETPDQYSLYEINGQHMISLQKNVIIKKENVAECYLNTTELWNMYNFTQSPVMAMIKLICLKGARVYMLPYAGHRHDVMSYVQIGDPRETEKDNCITHISDWNQLSAGTDMRVLMLLDNIYTGKCENCTVTDCKNLRNIGTLYWRNTGKFNETLLQQLSCEPVYSNMAEIMFQNFSLSKFPDEFVSMFPNLQTLELPYNKFTKPPDVFPWTDRTYNLPRNISRNTYLQDHYSKSSYLRISATQYRRLFNLDFNLIQNLSEYQFHGYIQIISLKGNHMVDICDDVFLNVTGLQNIDLSHNLLKYLPLNIFKGLSELHKLDLRNNMIQFVDVGIFDDLKALQYLNLGHNRLSVLPSGLFITLYNLEVLHLEHNSFTTFNARTFPVDSTVLKEIYVNNNPLTSFPEFIFWLRGLSNANFENTSITLSNLTSFIKEMDKQRLIYSIIDSASDSNFDDLKKRSPQLRNINLSRCKIQSLYLEYITEDMHETMILLLQHFRIILTDNPLLCDCKITTFTNFVRSLRDNGTVAPEEYYFHEWLCKSPEELGNKALLAIKDEETKCPVINVTGCPSECSCFKRSVSGNIIVDCKNRSLGAIHDTMPEGTLELIYYSNNISRVTAKPFLQNVTVLDLSCNKIITIDEAVFSVATDLRELYLQSNLLSYLPQSIARLNLVTVALRKNPFLCDCKSLWMKVWIKENRHVIKEWNKLSCSNKATGKTITEVKDSDFVCTNSDSYLVPSVTCSMVAVLLVTVGAIVYIYRLECKVLIYVYFGFHPFDRNNDKENETFDCVIVHAKGTTDWVMKNLVQRLESEENRFIVCDMDRDFVIGFSVQENLTHMVQQSKRIVFCLSSDWKPSDDSFKLAWNIAEQKIKETKSNYGIIVGHKIATNKITDKHLLRFIKRERFIDSSQRLFAEKVIYSMPRKHQIQTKKNELTIYSGASTSYATSLSWNERTANADSGPENRNYCDAFISYSTDDTYYVTKEIQPLLESKGYTLCIADRDFIPGASKEENILAAINYSMRTVFILSRNHAIDEWSLFTFRTAYEKSLRERSNHLIVVIKDEVDTDVLDKEVEQYLSSYVSLNVKDRWFEKKLFNGLPLVKHRRSLHSSPLFGISKDNIEVDIENDASVNYRNTRSVIQTQL